MAPQQSRERRSFDSESVGRHAPAGNASPFTQDCWPVGLGTEFAKWERI